MFLATLFWEVADACGVTEHVEDPKGVDNDLGSVHPD